MITLDVELVRRFVLALFIGALVGVEREKRRERQGLGIAGLRSFTLFALTGATSAWLGQELDVALLFPGTGAGLVAVLATARAEEVDSDGERSPGVTTKAAAILVFLLGGACIFGQAETAVAIAVTVAGLLALKAPLHTLVARIGSDDLVAGLKLLFASFIVLPVLPDHPVDPWGALNPYKLWLLVVLISVLSLGGYIAVRILGTRRGTALTGLFGGLVSSTAVTLAFARESRHSHAVSSVLGAGVLLAWTVMFVRVLAEVAIVHAPLLPPLVPPMAAMAGASGLAAALCYRGAPVGSAPTADASPAAPPDPARPAEGDSGVALKNPFSLSAAIRFAAFFAVILLAIELVRTYVPTGGVYAVAALAGTTDVDAITLSMASSVQQGGDATEAVRAIGIAAMCNTLVKTGLVLSLATPALKRLVGLAAGAVVAAGVTALVLAG